MPTCRSVAATARPPMPAPTTATDNFFLLMLAPTLLSSPASLLARYARFIDHRIPFFDVGREAAHEFLRRPGMGDDADLGEARLDILLREDLVHRLVHFIDHIFRRALRCEDAVPGLDLVAFHAGLGDCRHVRRQRRALRRGTRPAPPRGFGCFGL